MKLHLAWLFALAAASLSAQAPVPSTGRAFVLGRVVDGTSGRPLPDVTVTLSGPPRAPDAAAPQVRTSADGYFLFAGLARGSYSIAASKGGYVNGAHGKLQPSGGEQTLDLADNERRTDITIPMWRFASISGTVADEAGEPLIGVPVRLLRRSIVGGAWRLTFVATQATDDRGIYRAGQLVPGDYLVAIATTIATVPTKVQDAYSDGIAGGTVSPYQAGIDAASGSPLAAQGGVRVGDLLLKVGGSAPFNGPAEDAPRIRPPDADGRLFVYPTLYYPAESTPARATVITLGSGEDRANVDFQQRPVLSTRISGVVIGPEGPAPTTEVSLMAAGTEALAREQYFESATAVSDAAGRFTFLGVTPGDYTLKVLRVPARTAPTNSAQNAITVQVGGSTISSIVVGPRPPIPLLPTLSGTVPVSVTDREVTGVVVTLREGAHLGGHAEFVGAAPRPTADQLQRVLVNIDAADGRSTGPANTFQILQAQFDARGLLTSYQLPPSRYVVRAAALGAWKFAGATLDGKDVTDAPFELGTADVDRLVLTYSDRQADLTGTARDDTRAPAAAAEVILFPSDSGAWTGYGTVSRRIRNAGTGRDGTFTFAGVPPGEYCVVAVPVGAAPEWQDPATLRRLVPLSTTVTIGEGERKTQDVVVRSVRQP
jgi:hypothetical protein